MPLPQRGHVGRKVSHSESEFDYVLKLCETTIVAISKELDRPRLAENFVARLEQFRATVKKLERPPALFWLNYFSTPYLARIGEDCLDDVLLRKRDLRQGKLIYLADYPWQNFTLVLSSDGHYHNE